MRTIFILRVPGNCDGTSTREMRFLDRALAVKIGRSGYNNSAMILDPNHVYKEGFDFHITEEQVPETMTDFLNMIDPTEVAMRFANEPAAAEAIRRGALSKLSAAERAALGI